MIPKLQKILDKYLPFKHKCEKEVDSFFIYLHFIHIIYTPMGGQNKRY